MDLDHSKMWGYAFQYLIESNNSSSKDWILALILTNDEPNFYQDPTYVNNALELKVITAFLFMIQLVGTCVPVTMFLYERMGYAGPYRTVVNQLASTMTLALSGYVWIPVFMDFIRIWTGPWPAALCNFVVFTKDFFPMTGTSF